MPFGGAGHLSDQIFHAPGAKLWHYATELCTLSVTYPLYGLALTNTTHNPSEMCHLQPVFVNTINHTQSYKCRLFTQWFSQDVKTGRASTDGRASTLATSHSDLLWV